MKKKIEATIWGIVIGFRKRGGVPRFMASS